MTHRDFDAEAREAAGEPITFTLGGVLFICRHPFPVGSLLEFAATHAELEQLPPGAPGRISKMMVALADLLRGWITPDQHDAWAEVLRNLGSITTLEQVVAWIVEEVTGRPTSAPSFSPAPVDGAGLSSTGA